MILGSFTIGSVPYSGGIYGGTPPQVLLPLTLVNTSDIYIPTISTYINIAPSLYENTSTIYPSTIGAYKVLPPGIINTSTIYSLSVELVDPPYTPATSIYTPNPSKLSISVTSRFIKGVSEARTALYSLTIRHILFTNSTLINLYMPDPRSVSLISSSRINTYMSVNKTTTLTSPLRKT